MKRLAAWTVLALVASGTAALAARNTPASTRRATPVVTGPRATGPVPVTAPPSAVFAETETDLRRLLEDAHGPSEIWLRPHDYRGDFVAARTVAIKGELGATLTGTHTGTVITLTAPDSALENVTVRGSGRRNTTEDAGVRATAPRVAIRHVTVVDSLFGVSLGPCAACRVEHVHVTGDAGDPELRGDGVKLWEASDSVVSDTFVEDSRDVVIWYSRRTRFERNTVTRSRYGAHFMYSHDSAVRQSRMENDVVGIFVMYSSRVRIDDNVLAGARGAAGIGVGFKESDGVSLSGNWFVANTTGAYLDRTPRSPNTPVYFEDNVFALNETALRLHSSEAGVTFAKNDFRSNTTSVEVEGGGNALGATFRRNYWSDYTGYDLDHDSVGDVPYEVSRLSSDLLEEHPSLRLFSGTATMALIDTIARAAPVFASQRLLVDEEPRVAYTERKPPP